MLAIAGAILIHAACILMAGGKDSADLYSMRLFLIVVGASLIGADGAVRFFEFRKKWWEGARAPAPGAEPGAAPGRRDA